MGSSDMVLGLCDDVREGVVQLSDSKLTLENSAPCQSSVMSKDSELPATTVCAPAAKGWYGNA